MARDVFISYEKKDQSHADRLCSALESAGISCWIAPRDIPPGQEWPAAIVAGIKRSKNLVLILSSHSSNSRQISREVETADRYHLHMVSVRVEDVQPSESLEYFLQNIQWLDAFGGRFDDAVTRLIAALQTAPPAERTQNRRAFSAPRPEIKPGRRPRKALWAAAIAALLLLTAAYFVFRPPPQPVDLVTEVETSGLIVTGTGASGYTVSDPSGKSLGSRTTNASLDLPPGDYIVEMHGIRKPVKVRQRRRTAIAAATLIVAGSGANAYSVSSRAPTRILASKTTNAAIDLFAGDYTVELQGVQKNVSVQPGHRITLNSGTFVVAGTGANAYSVYDPLGKILVARTTNAPCDLFAGDYTIELQGVKKPATVREGQRTTLTAGSFVVAGTAGDAYSVYDAAGSQILGARTTNAEFDLFPGDYIVELVGVRQSVTVREAQRTTLTAGTLAVSGSGTSICTVYEASTQRLLGSRTDRPFDLLPGDYIVEIRGVRKKVKIQPGQKTTVR